MELPRELRVVGHARQSLAGASRRTNRAGWVIVLQPRGHTVFVIVDQARSSRSGTDGCAPRRTLRCAVLNNVALERKMMDVQWVLFLKSERQIPVRMVR